jgi:hypothetical protein
VSSDSDFTSLAIRLRGSGRTVYGMGLRKTPEALRQAVDRFVFLEDLHDGGGSSGDDADGTETRRIPDLRRLLERAVNGTAHDDGWASLSSIANHVTRVEPSFSVKDYGASKLVDLVRSQGYLDVEQPESGAVRVRLRSNRSGQKTAAKKTTTKRTAARKSTAKKAAEPPAQPAAEPAAEPPAQPAAEPAADPSAELAEAAAELAPRHTVTTRRRSARKA